MRKKFVSAFCLGLALSLSVPSLAWGDDAPPADGPQQTVGGGVSTGDISGFMPAVSDPGTGSTPTSVGVAEAKAGGLNAAITAQLANTSDSLAQKGWKINQDAAGKTLEQVRRNPEKVDGAITAQEDTNIHNNRNSGAAEEASNEPGLDIYTQIFSNFSSVHAVGFGMSTFNCHDTETTKFKSWDNKTGEALLSTNQIIFTPKVEYAPPKKCPPRTEKYLKTGTVDYEPVMQEHSSASSNFERPDATTVTDRSHPYQIEICVKRENNHHTGWGGSCIKWRTETRYRKPPNSTLIAEANANYGTQICPNKVLSAGSLNGYMDSDVVIGGGQTPMIKNSRGEDWKGKSTATGCAYMGHLKVRYSEYMRVSAHQHCVWSISYGKGLTWAGQIWDENRGNNQKVTYKTPYAMNPTFGACQGTVYSSLPEPGKPPLLPDRLLGRYTNTIRYVLDDPDLDVTGCRPTPDGKCEKGSIKIVGHHFTVLNVSVMKRATCSPHLDATWRKDGTVSVFQPNNIHWDTVKGQKLTYTLNDCMGDLVPKSDRYYCGVSDYPKDKGDFDITGTAINPDFEKHIPFDSVILGKRLNIVSQYEGKYSTPGFNNAPVESIDSKVPTGAELTAQKNQTYKSGISIMRNGETKYYTFPKPKVFGPNSRGRGAPSNLRITNTFLLMHKNGTPLVSTPVAKQAFSIDGDGKITPKSGGTKKIENPWLPPEKEKTDKGEIKERYNVYFTPKYKIDQYGDADKLDFRVHSPRPLPEIGLKAGEPVKSIIPYGAMDEKGVYGRWKDYYMYDLTKPTTSIGFSGVWMGENSRPVYVAPAFDVRGKFPLLSVKLNKVRSWGGNSVYNTWQQTNLFDGRILCIGADTPVSVYKSAG